MNYLNFYKSSLYIFYKAFYLLSNFLHLYKDFYLLFNFCISIKPFRISIKIFI